MSEPSPIVLVVDDEIQIRRFLRAGFELNGFVVHEAGSGAEAIRAATLRPIDLVIVDLGLPDMDGSEVVERIRSWSSMPISRPRPRPRARRRAPRPTRPRHRPTTSPRTRKEIA